MELMSPSDKVTSVDKALAFYARFFAWPFACGFFAAPFTCILAEILSSALKAWEVFVMLW